jgi:hypothetical protein
LPSMRSLLFAKPSPSSQLISLQLNVPERLLIAG